MRTEKGTQVYPESRLPLTVRDIAAASMAATIAIGGVLGYQKVNNLLEDPVDTQLLKPLSPEPDNTNSKFVVASGNTQGKLYLNSYRKSLKRTVAKTSADVLVLQETKATDPLLLQEEYPEANIHWMRADKMQEMGSGGFGNTIVAFRKDVKPLPSKSLPGKTPITNASKTVMAGAMDLMQGHTSMKGAKEALRENRVIGGLVMKAYDGFSSQDVTIITTHIGGHSDVKPAQTDQAFNYIDEQTKGDKVAIACGDFNNSPKNIIKRFVKIGYYVDRTGPTTKGNEEPIDFCAYKGIDVLGLPEVSIIKQREPDHDMLMLKFDLPVLDQDQ